MRALRSFAVLVLAACGAPTPTTPVSAGAPLLSVARIEAILDAPTTGAPALSPDGTRVLYVSSRGDAQLYLGDVAHPEAPARALVTGEERVGSATFTRDGQAVLFRRDTGADENFHIFRVGLDGSGLVDLTPGPEFWRDHPLLPRDLPDTMVYSRRTSTDYASSVIVQSTLAPTEAPRVVYRDPAPAAIVDVSPDGGRALLLREGTVGKQLVEIDLATGAARQLAPAADEIAMIQAAAYTHDGRRVYVARDRGPEAYTLVLLDLATLAPVAEHQPPGAASVAAVVPSPRGDRVAMRVDSGSDSRVRILDAATLAPIVDVESPLGTVYVGTNTEVNLPYAAGTFSDDGQRFVVMISTPSIPDDIFIGDATTGELSPLASGARAPTAPIAASVDAIPAFDGQRIPVNVYLPTDIEPGRRLPTIVFLHGGPDQHASMSWSGIFSALMAAGFALVEPNVRGSSGFGRTWEMADNMERRVDALRDVESVNRWLRAQPWSDPERLVISGASYGGYLTLLVLTREQELWRAAISLCGPSDLFSFVPSDATPHRYHAEFGDLVRDAALLRELSPLQHADAIRTPLFVYQGENDPRVPREHSDAIVAALRGRGVGVEYMVAANEGHTIARRENRIEYLTRVLAFLQATLEL